MAHRNVPDDITPGVMQNTQDNRGGEGETDLSATRRKRQSTANTGERRNATSSDWSGTERRRDNPGDAKKEGSPDFEATLNQEDVEKTDKRNTM